MLGDVGGQRTLRPYWRNYYEKTDAIVWLVDYSDRLRITASKEELHNLLVEEVRMARSGTCSGEKGSSCIDPTRESIWFAIVKLSLRVSMPTSVFVGKKLTQ